MAHALHDLSGTDGPLSVFNAALALLDGFAVWLGRIRARVGGPGSLVLTHLETLAGTEALALAALLDKHEGAWPRLIGTPHGAQARRHRQGRTWTGWPSTVSICRHFASDRATCPNS